MADPIFTVDPAFYNVLIPVGVTMRPIYGFTTDNNTYTRQPPWKGLGYIAGEAPDGLVTFNGDGAVRTLDLWDRAENVCVMSTVSAADGTYRFDGLNLDRLFDVRARGVDANENDLIAARIAPESLPPAPYALPDVTMRAGETRVINLTAAYGQLPFTWAITGPGWATLSGDQITLAPTAADTGTITATVTDALGKTGSVTFDVVALAAGAFKYWRVFITAANSTPVYGSIQELEFRATVGGATLCTGGSPIASSYYTPPDYFPSIAFDGDITSVGPNPPECWAASGIETQPWLGYVLPAPSAVSQIMVCARHTTPAQSPKDFTIQASDDGAAWVDQWSVTNQTAWAAGEIRTFNRP